jgi:polar amino acid transport system substrate-binding protein
MFRPCAFLLIGIAVCGAAETVTIAFEDGAQPPWTNPDASGVDHDLLKLVGAQVGVTFTMQCMPWKRCLSQMQEDKVDGTLNASFKDERLAMGHYPMGADGKADPGRKLHDDSYSLYRAKGAALSWDGTAFQGLSGKLGAQSGFSIIDMLKKLGAQVDDEAKDKGAILKKLAAGRIQGAALHTVGADQLLKAQAELGGTIEKVEPPLVVKPYYLMLSKGFVAKKPELAKAIWDAIAVVRESPAYQQILARY